MQFYWSKSANLVSGDFGNGELLKSTKHRHSKGVFKLAESYFFELRFGRT
jgi:hypothetical protein